eukprot:TRINITY_DN4554_c1_g1_i3.p1 TRINITY_DN4554_c1_g1~~TRINITY_DN4554_c1_g1_i3.p1  ORF type:complete len:133 (-),score=2.41 TRINITY_DN4554_c1_g1_i3:47-445(-)
MFNLRSRNTDDESESHSTRTIDFATFDRSVPRDYENQRYRFTAEFLDDATVKITVDDPQKVGSMVDRTLSFRVKGISILFDPPEFCVRRNWQDFLWLERALVTAYPHVLVPMIAKKNRTFNFNGIQHTDVCF